MFKIRKLDHGGWRDLAGPYSLEVAVWLLKVLEPRYGRDGVAITAA